MLPVFHSDNFKTWTPPFRTRLPSKHSRLHPPSNESPAIKLHQLPLPKALPLPKHQPPVRPPAEVCIHASAVTPSGTSRGPKSPPQKSSRLHSATTPATPSDTQHAEWLEQCPRNRARPSSSPDLATSRKVHYAIDASIDAPFFPENALGYISSPSVSSSDESWQEFLQPADEQNGIPIDPVILTNNAPWETEDERQHIHAGGDSVVSETICRYPDPPPLLRDTLENRNSSTCPEAQEGNSPSDSPLLAWRLLYVIAAVFGANTLLKIGVVLHRNGAFANSWSDGDVISHADGSMRIEIYPGRPVVVQPGQYIDLWIPSLNPWSWFQSASFIVTSWSTEKQSTLQLYAKCPNRPLGFTWLLLWRALRNSRRNLILFSGPHGISVPASRYETVLLVASDSGILAMRPYVDQLFHCVTKRTSKTRRLCLVWNVTRRSSNHFVSDIFGWVNKLLLNDIEDHTKMLSVKIYNAQGVLKTQPGQNGSRGEVIRNQADLPALSCLLAEEVQAHQERIRADDMKERGGMLVMASASDIVRDNLRQSVKAYLAWVRLVELDYQPTVNPTPGLLRRLM
ncbi:hypothetical protein KXX44_009845 [Aspergillus fumigatus]|nr:hypothetical protein KXX44_009845 [Aspergillus fumigatus]